MEPAIEETPTQRAERERQELRQAAAETAERERQEFEEFRAREAERQLQEKQQYEELMTKAPAAPEVVEVETPEVSQVEAVEPQQIEREAEQPQAPESKWSKLKERDAEPAAPEPVQVEQPESAPVEQQDPETPKPAKRREPRQERQLIRLSAAQREDREVIAVATEKEDGGAHIDWQLAHYDPAAEGQTGLHFMTKEAKVSRRIFSAEQWQRLQQTAGENRTQVKGKQVLALRTNLRPDNKSYAANLKVAKPSEHQIGPDVLQKQQAAEDRAREQASREAHKKAGKTLERMLPEHEKDPKERPDITD